ncbi:MAG: zf-HC2 domain-containing protein [Pseudomonadota bacterium]
MGLKPTCREVHRLTSERLDRDLTLVERARMGVHLLVCAACRNFGGQMALIRRAMRQTSVPDDHEENRR